MILRAKLGVYALSVADEVLSPADTIDRVARLGLERCLFPSVLSLSPTLNHTEIVSIIQRAAAVGVSVVAGLPNLHPLRVDSDRTLRELGGGDAITGLTRLLEATAELGVRDLPVIIGRIEDRYAGTASWRRQLEAFRALVTQLAPVLRDRGVRLAIKTHEEISGFDISRLCADLGEDLVSVGFDPVNLLLNLQDPERALRQLTGSIAHVFLDDAVFEWDGKSATRLLCELGTGCVPWVSILAGIAGKSVQEPMLWIELHRGQFSVQPFDQEWLQHHPDIGAVEYLSSLRLMLQGGWSTSPLRHAEARRRQGVPTSRMEGALKFCRDEQLLSA